MLSEAAAEGRERPGPRIGPRAARRLAPGAARRGEIPAVGRAGRRRRDRPPVPDARPRRHRPPRRATRSSTACAASGTSATRCSARWSGVRGQVHDLADLRGPAGRRPRPARPRLRSRSRPTRSRAARPWSRRSGDYGVDLGRVELDLGFGRGIGFYSQMIFELVVPDARRARSRSAAAAGTTAWPASWAATATTAGSASPSAWNGSRSVLDAAGSRPAPRPARGLLVVVADAARGHRRTRSDLADRSCGRRGPRPCSSRTAAVDAAVALARGLGAGPRRRRRARRREAAGPRAARPGDRDRVPRPRASPRALDRRRPRTEADAR